MGAGEKFEKPEKPQEKGKTSPEKSVIVDDFEQFLLETKKRIEEKIQKNPDAKRLMGLLDKKIAGIQEKYAVIKEKYDEQKDGLRAVVEVMLSRFENQTDLLALLGKDQELPEIPEGESRFFMFYTGKPAQPVELQVNSLFQMEGMSIEGKKINFRKPLNAKSFQSAFDNGKIALLAARKIPGFQPDVPLVAEGTSRFFVTVKNVQYEIVSAETLYAGPRFSSDDPAERAKIFIVEGEEKQKEGGIDVVKKRQLKKLYSSVTEKKSSTTETVEGDDDFTIEYKSGMNTVDRSHYHEGLCDAQSLSLVGAGIADHVDRTMLPNGMYISVSSVLFMTEQMDEGKMRKVGDKEIRSIFMFSSDKKPLGRVSYQGGKIDFISFLGDPKKTVFYDPDDQRPMYSVTEGKGVKIKRLIGLNGEEVADYQTEKKKNPKLTTQTYLWMLSAILNTPKKWQIFVEQFMQYVYDSEDPDSPLTPGTKEKHGDYWQSPDETLQRVKNGQCLGDCDDYAFLIQAIMQKQGRKTYIVAVPNHAICAWIEKKPNGKYDAFSVCTFGYDRNGNRLGELPDPTKEAGYDTPEQALNAVFKKYEKPGLGVDEAIHYRVEKGYVEILSIPKKGKGQAQMVRVEDLVINP